MASEVSKDQLISSPHVEIVITTVSEDSSPQHLGSYVELISWVAPGGANAPGGQASPQTLAPISAEYLPSGHSVQPTFVCEKVPARHVVHDPAALEAGGEERPG